MRERTTNVDLHMIANPDVTGQNTARRNATTFTYLHFAGEDDRWMGRRTEHSPQSNRTLYEPEPLF